LNEELRAWSNIIADWARSNQYVSEVWFFGSRARGSNSEESDLDVAIVMAGSDAETRYNDWFDFKSEWRAALQALLPVTLDLQLGDSDFSKERVWPAIQREGLLVFRRDGGEKDD
jgi:predicted nucleotidyltransferase